MFTEEKSLSILKKSVTQFPETLMVLGSGWNKILGDMAVEKSIPFSTLFGVSATVPGHEGKLVIGTIGKKRVACMSGRIHMYEGYTAHQATLPYRVFAKMGMKSLILTAACGALNEKYKVGDFIVLSDMITLFLALDNPLKGPQFIDVSEVYDIELRKKAVQVCGNNSIPFHEGTYVYYHGPNYETPADKMALRFLGGDVVGMSTVPETLAARACGVRVLGLAFVTNLAFVKHSHKEVVEEANKASKKMSTLLAGVMQ